MFSIVKHISVASTMHAFFLLTSFSPHHFKRQHDHWMETKNTWMCSWFCSLFKRRTLPSMTTFKKRIYPLCDATFWLMKGKLTYIIFCLIYSLVGVCLADSFVVFRRDLPVSLFIISNHTEPTALGTYLSLYLDHVIQHHSNGTS